MVAYTVAGCASAALVGAAIGLAGAAILDRRREGLVLATVACVALAARDLGWIRFPLPQHHRQTEKMWAHEFGIVMAAALWGTHIGLAFATRIRFGGLWATTLLVAAFGSPLLASASMLAYWLGRASSVWIAPALVASSREAVDLCEMVSADSLYRRIAIGGLAGLALTLGTRI